MKISQINNQQTNFKGGVVGKPGSANLILEAYPALKGRVAQGKIVIGKMRDYFVFSPLEEAGMQVMVSDRLNRARMLEMSIGDRSAQEPITMKELRGIYNDEAQMS